MHDRLFENQKSLVPIEPHAEAIGLDMAAFEACMSSGKYSRAIRDDIKVANQAGVTGTPGFLLARNDPSDPSKVIGIAFIRGAQPFAAFKAAIDEALKAD